LGGPGVEQRLALLRRTAEQQLLKPLQTHGWAASITSENPNGEYFLIDASKGGQTHKVALLYTSATANTVYKTLDGIVEHIFVNGGLYMVEQFAYGIAATVSPVEDFFPILLSWNKQIAPNVAQPRTAPSRPIAVRHITSETPLVGIWSRLDQFQSINLAHKLIARRATDENVVLDPAIHQSKAEGLAFSLRNASDYFRAGPTDRLNKRILSLYYGTLAFAFAEMLSTARGPQDLDELEGMTKSGHGLYTLPSGEDDFGGLVIGVLATGFFPNWISFLGQDVSAYPKKKAKAIEELAKYPPASYALLRDLLAAVPELGDLFLEVFDSEPAWLTPVYNLFDNKSGPGLGTANTGSTYIHLFDRSGRIDPSRMDQAGPLTEIVSVQATGNGREYRARVDHPGLSHWHQALNTHGSPYLQNPALILPTIGGNTAFRVNALVILYALSIVVRYMPSVWRRIEGGDWDEHRALIESLVDVYERILPEQFLGSVIGEQIQASQPGRF
jgi:hypothetical protein